MAELDELRDRLAELGEEIADEAIRRLRAARATKDDGERAALVTAEKRLTRARRAVEKAVHLLDGDVGTDGGDE